MRQHMKATVAAVAFTIACGYAVSADANTIQQILTSNPSNQVDELEDQDYEFIVRPNEGQGTVFGGGTPDDGVGDFDLVGNLGDGISDNIQIGDVLGGFLEIQTIIQPPGGTGTNIGGNSPNNELQFLFLNEVTAISATNPLDPTGEQNIELGATSSANWNSIFGVTPNNSQAIALLYEGTNNDFSVDENVVAGTGPEEQFNSVTDTVLNDGTRVGEVGFGKASDQLVSRAPLDASNFNQGGGQANLGALVGNFSILEWSLGGFVKNAIQGRQFASVSGIGTEFAPTFHDFVITQSELLDGEAATIDLLQVRSDIDFQMVAIPTPATIGLLGLGLIGLGVMGRRRSS